MVTLPSAAWRERPDLPALIAALGGEAGQVRFVGGAVRDTLLGLPVADLDLATRFRPETVIERLRTAGIKAIPTGIKHGTVTAVLPDGPVEVTTLRRDVATDGRHAQVAFTDDWREDAARRDFTINALYADPASGEVIDYFGGIADLEHRLVRFIGDPAERIAEDHLRILRFFRFLARFGDQADAAGLSACAARANDLMALSRERIRDELLKLLVAPRAEGALTLMLQHRILAPVLPEITSLDRLTRLTAREAAAGIAADPIRRLAALLPASSVESVGARLKLSNAQRKRLEGAIVPRGDAAPRVLAYRIGVDGARDRLLLDDGPLADVADIEHWTPPRLPIGGGALVERGLSRGPEIARALRQVETRWIEEGFPAADRVAAIADAVADQALRTPGSLAKASSAETGREKT